MSRKLKVSFICTEVAGVAFYRIVQPARYLEKHGCEVRVMGYDKDDIVRPEWENLEGIGYGAIVISDIQNAVKWADVTVWMALHMPESFRLFGDLRNKFPKKKFISEFDDTVISIPAHNIGSTVYFPGSILTAISTTQMKLSDALVVSTPNLKEQLSQYNKEIYVAENAVDLHLWRRSSSLRQRISFGWVGGGSHNVDLELVKNAVFSVLEDNPKTAFKCIHGCPEFFKHEAWCPWKNTNDPRHDKSKRCAKCGGIPRIEWTHDFKPIERYPKWVSRRGLDIGIAPLEDNYFNRAKSNLRWLEYSAMGIPTIASNIGHFKETIRHGETGFLANTEKEWVELITALVKDRQLREGIGRAAMREVREAWSPKIMGEKYKAMLKGVLANAKSDKIKSGVPDSNAHQRSERTTVHGEPGSRRNPEGAGMVCS